MLLPTKYINVQSCYLSLGALILKQLDEPQAVSTLWYNLKSNPEIGTYQRYVLTLFILYSLGTIDYKDGFVYRSVS